MIGKYGENIFILVDVSLLVGSIDGKVLFKINVIGIVYVLVFGIVDNIVMVYFVFSMSWFFVLYMNDQDELLDNCVWWVMVEFY